MGLLLLCDFFIIVGFEFFYYGILYIFYFNG
jgi:hypothetical protein